MSRTNTGAYESIKTSQIVFQNPDRTFPEPGSVLAINNLRGATSWSRNLDIESVALSGPSSVGTLTYDNQLLVNGIPVGGGGGGADVSGGSNIAVDMCGGVHRVSLAVREDIDMCSNSIINCKTIELPRIPNTSSAKITFGSLPDNKYAIISYEDLINTLLITSDTNVETRGSDGVIVIGAMGISGETTHSKSITNVVKSGYSTKVSSMELNAANTLTIGATDISTNPAIVFQGGKAADPNFNTNARIDYYDAAGVENLRFTSSNYSFQTVPFDTAQYMLGYNLASGNINYQHIATALSYLNSGYNISYNTMGRSFDMDISQPVLMNDNPVVNASYIDLSAGGVSGKLYYSNPSIISTKHLTISGIENPYIRLQGSSKYGSISYQESLEETGVYGKNINIMSDDGSYYASSGTGLTMSSQTNQRVWINITSSGVIKSSLYLSNNNELIIGDLQIPANPVLIFQGGKAAQSNLDTSAKIEYFDASGVEQLRFTSNNYAFNAVPAAGTALPTVLGYDTSSGEIKVQPVAAGAVQNPMIASLDAGNNNITNVGSLSTTSITYSSNNTIASILTSGTYTLSNIFSFITDNSKRVLFRITVRGGGGGGGGGLNATGSGGGGGQGYETSYTHVLPAAVQLTITVGAGGAGGAATGANGFDGSGTYITVSPAGNTKTLITAAGGQGGRGATAGGAGGTGSVNGTDGSGATGGGGAGYFGGNAGYQMAGGAAGIAGNTSSGTSAGGGGGSYNALLPQSYAGGNGDCGLCTIEYIKLVDSFF